MAIDRAGLLRRGLRLEWTTIAWNGVDTLVAVTGFGAGDSNRAINPLQRIPFDLALKRAYDDKSRQGGVRESET